MDDLGYILDLVFSQPVLQWFGSFWQPFV